MSVLQKILDIFFYSRQHIVAVLAFLTLRLYGKESRYSEVVAGTYFSRQHVPLSLENAQNIDMLLAASESRVTNAEKRRNVITEKCKTLLTLGSLLLTVIGLLLPKYLAFEIEWMKWLSVISVALLFNAIIVLLVFFDVGQDMDVAISNQDAQLDTTNLQKSLLNRNLQCLIAAENRTDYLVDLYRAVRFVLLTALVIVAGIVLTSLAMNKPGDMTKIILQEIRSDPHLSNLLQGPKGDPGQDGKNGGIGPKGDRGEKGYQGKDADVDAIVTRLLSDTRLRDAIQKAAASPDKTKITP